MTAFDAFVIWMPCCVLGRAAEPITFKPITLPVIVTALAVLTLMPLPVLPEITLTSTKLPVLTPLPWLKLIPPLLASGVSPSGARPM
jgi:hypothetical protein